MRCCLSDFMKGYTASLALVLVSDMRLKTVKFDRQHASDERVTLNLTSGKITGNRGTAMNIDK